MAAKIQNKEVKFRQIIDAVRQGIPVLTAAASVKVEELELKRWLRQDENYAKRLKAAEAKYITVLRKKVEEEKDTEAKKLLMKQLELADPDFSKTKVQRLEIQKKKQKEDRQRKLRSLLSQPSWGRSGWNVRKRQLTIKLNKDQKLTKADASTLYYWGMNRKDLKERYEYEKEILGLSERRIRWMVEAIEKVIKRELTTEERDWITESQITTNLIPEGKDSYKINDGAKGIFYPKINVDWGKQKKRGKRISNVGGKEIDGRGRIAKEDSVSGDKKRRTGKTRRKIQENRKSLGTNRNTEEQRIL